MNRLTSRLLPVMLITLGIYLVIIPYILPLRSEISFSLINAFSQTFIIAGIIFYAIQLIQKRLTKIEDQLDMNKENKINSVSLIPSENSIYFIEQLKRTRFVYKASMYLPNANIETLFFLKSFLNSIEIDSTTRIIINTLNADINVSNNIKEITTKYKNKIDLKKFESHSSMNYFIVILDTKIWILTSFGDKIKNNLLFSVSSYEEQGKSFIDLYNNIWNGSINFKSIEDGN